VATPVGMFPVSVTAYKTVTLAVADLVVSATLVAVTETEVVEVSLGAVKSPAEEMVPAEAVQVTAVFVVYNTVAANCFVANELTVAELGATETLTGGSAKTTVKLAVPRFRVESRAVTVKVYVPAVLHFPEILPVLVLMLNARGRLVAWYTYGPLPPLAFMPPE